MLIDAAKLDAECLDIVLMAVLEDATLLVPGAY
jgi:hypothetical protein